MPYAYLACAFLLNALANILLKLGSRTGLVLVHKDPISLLTNNWLLVLGCTVFAANVLFYFLALRALPISVAYPVMVVMSFIIINAYALLVLGESLSVLQAIGYAAIVLGLLLVLSNAPGV